MKFKCDKCDQPATFHAVEIVQGEKIEKHLCEHHAAQDGLGAKSANTPINELLTNFVKMSGVAQGPPSPQKKSKPPLGSDIICDDCGMTFREFRDKSLLGCPNCYRAFEGPLVSLLERAHEGGTHHVGKVPRRAGGGEQRQLLITRMRKRLDEAIATENYELAAQLRDEIGEMERQDDPTAMTDVTFDSGEQSDGHPGELS